MLAFSHKVNTDMSSWTVLLGTRFFWFPSFQPFTSHLSLVMRWLIPPPFLHTTPISFFFTITIGYFFIPFLGHTHIFVGFHHCLHLYHKRPASPLGVSACANPWTWGVLSPQLPGQAIPTAPVLLILHTVTTYRHVST